MRLLLSAFSDADVEERLLGAGGLGHEVLDTPLPPPLEEGEELSYTD